MTTTSDENSVMADSVCEVTKSQRSNPKSISYPSPPNSPSRTTEAFREETRPVTALCSSPLSPPTTPPRQSPASHVHEKQATEERVDAAKLRSGLGLDDKRCGAPTKKGSPCRCWSPAVNRAAVTSKLESMIGLTQSSMELEGELDTLAKFVHCKRHESGLPKRNRIEAWIQIFPMGEASAAISIEKEILKLLDLQSPQCIRVVDDTGTRCEQKIGVLETNMYCPEHISERSLQKTASWKSKIEGILAEHAVKLLEGGAPNETGAPCKVPNTQSLAESSSASEKDSLASSSGGLSIPNFDRDLSTYWPNTYKTSPFDIRERSKRLDAYKSSYKMIRGKINAPLEGMDLRNGYVYVYEVEGNSGFVKIGYTTRSVEERLQDWEFDCNRVPKALYPIPSSTATTIPHARRVEALCHAELNHRRIRIDCDCCFKHHVEWFEVSSTEAISIIQRWSNWMAKRPYKSSLRGGSKRIIREEERERAKDMDSFMRDISESIQLEANGSVR
ncbi:T5orf172 domain-containing protein [Fusarium tricinctum]|uniref:T5orf172 domain-containing protein n=1 Tax=Fusarium tricinctum TaxID=61284 RepID=A0A8K0RNL2_9HYPO|nr:T5orf172 domain-containing protein [Fusarium tricinctum]